MAGKLVLAVGVVLVVLGVVYHTLFFNGPLRSAVEDDRAQLLSWSLILVGGALGILGPIIGYLKNASDESIGLSLPAVTALTKNCTLRFAKLTILFCAIHLLLWVPIVISLRHGDSIRPMFQAPASVLLSAVSILAGIVETLKHLFLLRPRKVAFATLILATLPLLLFLTTEWYIHDVLRVTYKP